MDVLKRVWIVFFFLVAGVVLGAGACGFDPQIGDGAFACAADRSCPNGFVCAGDNKCYRPGNGPPVVTVDGGPGPDGTTPVVLSKLQADPISLAEGNASVPTDFVFTVRLDPPSTKEVTVDYATNDGTAKVNEDFAGAAGKLVFPPGSTSQTVTVKVTADRFEEPDETFTLKLSNPSNAELLAGAAPDITATIKNDDSPGLSIDDITVTEADQDSTAMLTVSLSGAYTTDVTVNFQTLQLTAGTTGLAVASESTDYLPASDTLTFAPGEKTKTVSVPIKGDLAHEKSEGFIVKLSAPVGAPLVDDEATVTITDNDLVPTITIADVSLAEGDVGTTNMAFAVTLSAASSEPITVAYGTGGGTASANDYSAASGTLTFEAGQTTKQIPVSIAADLVDENDETFIVTLSAPVGATLAKATATGTITDDDLPPVLSVQDVALAEGDSTPTSFPFVFTLSAPSSKAITVTYTTANGTATAGSDYTAVTGTVSFAPLETTKPAVNVVVTADTVAEAAETFNLNLTNPTNVTLERAAALGTIINDDGAAAKLAINDASISEGLSGTKQLVFTVTCTGTGPNVKADFSTTNGTAVADSDFVAPVSGTLAAADCVSGYPQNISITINGDSVHEPDETFTVNLSNPSGDTAITDSSGLGTIENDDTPPTISIVASASIAEGNAGSKTLGFDVSLDHPSSTSITVQYTTAAGTVNPATAGSDYASTNATLTFAPGETSKTINVTITGDDVYEENETFKVNLSNASANATLGTASATGTITNDDTKPTISINDVSAGEGNSGQKNFTFTVSLSGPTDVPVSVNYATSDGTASAGTDYAAKTGTATVPAGQLSTTFTVSVSGDGVFEQNEAFNVTLSTPSPVDYVISDATGVGTITNDDAARLLSINDPSVTEGSTITFTVTLSPGSNGNTTVNWTLVDVTTIANDHGNTLSGTLSFSNGQTSKTIQISTTGDSLDEIDETFEIRLSNVVGDAQISKGTGVGTIVDNDPSPTVSITQNVSKAEGNSGTSTMTFNVTLSGNTGRQVTVQWETEDVTAQGTGGNSTRDYEAATGLLTWNPGDPLTQTINITIRGDTRVEPDETFRVKLLNPVGTSISGGTYGTGTITSEEKP